MYCDDFFTLYLPYSLSLNEKAGLLVGFRIFPLLILSLFLLQIKRPSAFLDFKHHFIPAVELQTFTLKIIFKIRDDILLCKVRLFVERLLSLLISYTHTGQGVKQKAGLMAGSGSEQDLIYRVISSSSKLQLSLEAPFDHSVKFSLLFGKSPENTFR